jgi:hypothetical protein
MFSDLLSILFYFTTGLVLFCNYIERNKEKESGVSYFELDELSGHRHDIRKMHGSFFVTVTEVKKNKEYIKNGSSTCCLITYSGLTKNNISKMHSVPGVHNERLDCEIDNGRLKIVYRPTPRQDSNITRFYKIKTTML